MADHVTAVCKAGYLLRQLRGLVQSLTSEAAKSLVNAFISYRLDYCNSLLYGITDTPASSIGAKCGGEAGNLSYSTLVSGHRRAGMRSASAALLEVPRTRNAIGDRLFSVAGPRV